jgi:hypothetical protein
MEVRWSGGLRPAIQRPGLISMLNVLVNESRYAIKSALEECMYDTVTLSELTSKRDQSPRSLQR